VLIEARIFEKLFALFDEQLRERGVLAQLDKLVDVRFVDMPRQRSKRKENMTIQSGGVGRTARETAAEEGGRGRTTSGITARRITSRWIRKANSSSHIR